MLPRVPERLLLCASGVFFAVSSLDLIALWLGVWFRSWAPQWSPADPSLNIRTQDELSRPIVEHCSDSCRACQGLLMPMWR